MDLNAIAVFASVVEAGSFVAAAKATGISKSTAARRVSELEEALGVRLLQRSTRQMQLTDAGQAFYERCRRILADLEDATEAVTARGTEPRGLLRMTTSAHLADAFLDEWAVEYLLKYPEVELEMYLSTRKMDLIADGFDLAVRAGPLVSSSYIVRKLARAPQYVCASRGYLEEHGTPTNLEELKEHACILFEPQRAPSPWRLQRHGGDSVSFQVDGRIRVNGLPSAVRACRAGLGIALLPAIACCDEVLSGDLVHLFPEWSTTDNWVHALYPSRRHLSATVRTFIDFVADKLDSPPWELPAA